MKCLTAYSGGPGNGTFALAIDGVPVLLGISYYSTPSVVSDLMIVVNAGEVLSLNAPSPSSAQVSGYLLNDA